MLSMLANIYIYIILLTTIHPLMSYLSLSLHTQKNNYYIKYTSTFGANIANFDNNVEISTFVGFFYCLHGC